MVNTHVTTYDLLAQIMKSTPSIPEGIRASKANRIPGNHINRFGLWLLSVLGVAILAFAVPGARCDDLEGPGDDHAVQQPSEDLKAIAERGDANAQFKRGMRMLASKATPLELTEGVAWIQKAAAQGLPEAQSHLGEFYAVGAGVEADPKKAVVWWRKAATQGYAEAQYHLGYAYQEGRGVPRDLAAALAWYRKAAVQGFRRAQDSIGMMYDAEEGEPQEFAEARRKVVENELASAEFDLGLIYLNGRNIDKDEAKAIKWLTKAAEQGHTWAMFHLSRALLQRNTKGSSDLADGVKWLLKAAESGHPEARGILNVFLGEAGKAFKKKNQSPPAWFGNSLNWLRQKGEEGQAWAQFNLGMIYANGHALPPDKVEAYKWFSLAASQPKGAQWRERSAAFRRQLERNLTHEEVAEAKRRVAAISDRAKSPAAVGAAEGKLKQ